MKKKDFIEKYMNRKMKNHGLPYGMAYLTLRDRTEEEAEKKWKSMKKNERNKKQPPNTYCHHEDGDL